MKTLTVDLTRGNRQPISLLSTAIKAVGALWSASFLVGMTGDVWLASVVLVGYPAAWSVAWLVSTRSGDSARK